MQQSPPYLKNQPTQPPKILSRRFKMAISYGADRVVAGLIASGELDPNSRDEEGLTALMIAATQDRSTMCCLLIQSGAVLSAVNALGQDAWAVALISDGFAAASAIKISLNELTERTAIVVRPPETNNYDQFAVALDPVDPCASGLHVQNAQKIERNGDGVRTEISTRDKKPVLGKADLSALKRATYLKSSDFEFKSSSDDRIELVEHIRLAKYSAWFVDLVRDSITEGELTILTIRDAIMRRGKAKHESEKRKALGVDGLQRFNSFIDELILNSSRVARLDGSKVIRGDSLVVTRLTGDFPGRVKIKLNRLF